MPLNPEAERLAAADAPGLNWRLWGPYLSERQWATVREDYSEDGDAWRYFPHDMARRRAYRWGEDGIAGFSDERARLCLAIGLWNHQDRFLKERLFGLTGPQGNHGEDVKELYYYLDATPTHSYLRMLYKYPQSEFPYERLVEENGRRTRQDPEFELIDTGAFDENRYFDVFVEYAKAGPDDILMRVMAYNRGPEAAPLDLLLQLWFRNTWSWTNLTSTRPALVGADSACIIADEPDLGRYYAYLENADELLFCENETNGEVFGLARTGYPKDSFHDYVVEGRRGAINPARRGTKSAARFRWLIAPGESCVARLRLCRAALDRPCEDFDHVLAERRGEADAFYDDLQQGLVDPELRGVQRQALAGMIWSKQFYNYNIRKWVAGDSAQPPPPGDRRHGRNANWRHLNNREVLSMPDKWEYPWYAAWDLAFHCVPLALVDAAFAKQQLTLLMREWYMHPNGELPAYEWNFGDVNPPVHAWAAYRVFQIDRKRNGGAGDFDFLKRVFHKLLLNFTWWVNRKDVDGRNVFQGGFLGLDNIGVFDRNHKLPDGGFLTQADGTSWMAMYSLNLLRIALELALVDPVYEDIASKFFEHFLEIADAINNVTEDGFGLWDEEDGFYYDKMHLADGRKQVMRVRSMVGLIPLFAVETLEPEMLEQLPNFRDRLNWYLENRPKRALQVSRWNEPGRGERRLLSLLRGHRMKLLLKRMLDPGEFLSDHGVRALSRYHREHPFEFHCDDTTLSVDYEPAESQSNLFGGNSNWRGPIWFPVNFLIVESLQKFHHYYGDDFKVECPTGSGQYLTLDQIAKEISRRLCSLFLPDTNGRRPMYNGSPREQRDPHFRDLVLFHEYFDGDTGRGLGASHQTGWTGVVAKLIQPRRSEH